MKENQSSTFLTLPFGLGLFTMSLVSKTNKKRLSCDVYCVSDLDMVEMVC